jgi:hypothetical protein
MPHKRRGEVFNRLIYQLNAAFPQQGDGEPLHNRWKLCEEYSSQVIELLETYKWLKDDLGYPILLCEIATRCAWYSNFEFVRPYRH